MNMSDSAASPPRPPSVLASARPAEPGLGRDGTLHCLSWMRSRENGEAQMHIFRHVLVFLMVPANMENCDSVLIRL